MPSPFIPCDTPEETGRVVARVRRAHRITVFVPTGFDVYLRVLLPFSGQGDSPVPWREVAAEAGRELSASTSSDDLMDILASDLEVFRVNPTDPPLA